jgi:hypothetical protein
MPGLMTMKQDQVAQQIAPWKLTKSASIKLWSYYTKLHWIKICSDIKAYSMFTSLSLNIYTHTDINVVRSACLIRNSVLHDAYKMHVHCKPFFPYIYKCDFWIYSFIIFVHISWNYDLLTFQASTYGLNLCPDF